MPGQLAHRCHIHNFELIEQSNCSNQRRINQGARGARVPGPQALRDPHSRYETKKLSKI